MFLACWAVVGGMVWAATVPTNVGEAARLPGAVAPCCGQSSDEMTSLVSCKTAVVWPALLPVTGVGAVFG